MPTPMKDTKKNTTLNALAVAQVRGEYGFALKAEQLEEITSKVDETKLEEHDAESVLAILKGVDARLPTGQPASLDQAALFLRALRSNRAPTVAPSPEAMGEAPKEEPVAE